MALTTVPPPTTNGVQPPPVLRRRQPSRLFLLGVVLAVAGGLAGVYVYLSADDRTAVVGVMRAVPYGQRVVEADLREVRLPADSGLATVAWTDVRTVLGQVASTDLRPGQTLTRDAVGAQPVPGAGEAVVGMSVEAGQLPVMPLDVRDEVLVIDGKDPVAPSVRAVVLGAGATDVSGHRTVDLLVSEGVAAQVARSAASGDAVLVLVARR
ncbi:MULTISPECIES: SAF domain-containing protein [unclassified Pseudonocardia]|uniref:SAF domain-containing protein n=1 Tax=unclassified Pseudonocardia TaxID=2619320 RepID=UPI00096289AF|nr:MULTISPECIES: SAF domain-containing protein [unclassified Pseudonocardia]MBN9103114.1 SAF domain-containing protein [Pseudonocardia sp.]OJY41588.1 MAG: hypothetical protein BGP03_20535 [Pseudonocardia sp. 73-21]